MFEFFDHTGDVGVRLVASSLEELFGAAAGALTETITDLDRVEPSSTRSLELDAPQIEDLLVDWLSGLLYAFDVDGWLTRSVEARMQVSDGRCRLAARVSGERFDPERHQIKILVKGITYHGLQVVKTGGEWRAAVIFDI